jgi:hypothetical protein
MGLELRHGGTGGFGRWVLMTLMGFGLGFAFSPLMALMISRVPLADAADASGVIATLMQIGQVTGVATLGSLFLNLDGGSLASSAHAVAMVTFAAAGLCVLGAITAIRIPQLPRAQVVAAAAAQPAQAAH